MYVTASKDGAIRLWDGITANCVRSITAAHGTAEATSAIFTKDERYNTFWSRYLFKSLTDK
jgi:cleavage stimulation factor subunit 1